MIRFKAMSIDDEVSAHAALLSLLRNAPDIDVAMTCTSPAQALSALANERFELLFLDVAMPQMNGLELLRSIENPPVTVLLTAHVEHALTAFELGVRDYLLKPVSAQRLMRCLEHIRPLLLAARSESAVRAPSRLSIKCGNAYRLVDPARTLRVEAAGNFSTVHVVEEKFFASESMKDLEQRLAGCGFIRIHKSHLVNMRFVRTVSASEVHLDNGQAVPVGRAYRAAVVDALREAARMSRD